MASSSSGSCATSLQSFSERPTRALAFPPQLHQRFPPRAVTKSALVVGDVTATLMDVDLSRRCDPRRYALLLLLVVSCDCGEPVGGDACLTDESCGEQVCVNGMCVDEDEADIGVDAGPAGDATPSLDAATCLDVSLEFSGEPTLLQVPATARFLLVKAWGAGGNGDSGFSGGPGGFSSAIYEVTDPQDLTVVVGRLGRNDGDMAFGFGALGGGGLSGLFTGVPPLEATEFDRAILIAGGGGSAGRDEGPNGGAGNREEGDAAQDTDSMRGGNATFPGPGDRNTNTGGGGGLRGGIGRRNGSTGGLGGRGVVQEAPGMRLHTIGGVAQSVMDTASGALPPRQDDEDYPGGDCPPGTTECNGYMVIRVLCSEPPALI